MQFIVLLFLVSVLVSVSVSVDSDLEPFIFRGKEAKDGQFPYHIGIFSRVPGSKIVEADYICGGSLISETFILTAAHCIHDVEVEDITISLGSIHLMKGAERAARNKTVHPRYTGVEIDGNDIGLLKIDPISYSNTIKNINLPPFKDLNATYEGHKAVVSGWGYTTGSGEIPEILQYTNLLVISNTDCAIMYDEGEITEEDICAADPDGSLFCDGDTGGPLVEMDSNSLIGIVSFVPIADCESTEFGTAFTRVTSYRERIKDYTGI